MLFKNVKSGNVVSVTNKDIIDLMSRSANYVLIDTEAKESKPKKKNSQA